MSAKAARCARNADPLTETIGGGGKVTSGP